MTNDPDHYYTVLHELSFTILKSRSHCFIEAHFTHSEGVTKNTKVYCIQCKYALLYDFCKHESRK